MFLSNASPSASLDSGMVRLAARCVEKLTDDTGLGWRNTNICSVEGFQHSEQDLATVLTSYADTLEELHFLEPAEAMWLLAENTCPDELLVVHRFTDFTRAQEAMLAAWSQRDTHVLLTLPWQEGSPSTAVLDGLLGRFEALGAERTVLQNDVDFATHQELSELSRALFRQAEVEPGGAVCVLASEGERAEAVAIAREIRRLEASGVPLEQIAIVFRNPERHYRSIRQAFDEAEIPADYDVSLPIHSTPLGHAVVSLLGFGVSRQREELLGYLASAYGGIGADDLAALETKWRKQGISEGHRLLRDLGALSPTAGQIAEAAIACTSREVDVQAIADWGKLFGTIFQQAKTFSTRLPSALEEDARCLRAMMKVLSEVSEIKERKIAPRDLLAILRQQKVSVGEVERPGRVQVGSVVRMRARRFQAVILGGLTAAEFPAPAPEDMLPGGAVAHVLEAFGGSAQLSSRAPLERLLFAQSIAAAREHLTLSYCAADADGCESHRSPFLDELLDAYRDAEGNSKLGESYQMLAEVPGTYVGERGEREELRSLAYRADASEPRIRAARRRLVEAPAKIDLPRALEECSQREVFSASELETYLACPYRWFIERGLKPDGIDREFGAAEQGEFAHRLLATFYRHLADEGISRLSPSTRDLSERVIAAAYDEVVDRIGPAASGREEFERRETLKWAYRITKEDAEILQGFIPRFVEWEFMEEPVDMGGFLLRGRVDRIDVDSENRAVITDYKRSSGARAAEIESKGKIQLPLYMAAVSTRLELEVIGGLYRGLRKKSTRGLVRKGEIEDSGITQRDALELGSFENIMETALELARAAADGIRRSHIARGPRTASACAGCPAALACSGKGEK